LCIKGSGEKNREKNKKYKKKSAPPSKIPVVLEPAYGPAAIGFWGNLESGAYRGIIILDNMVLLGESRNRRVLKPAIKKRL
jgi:hypothetical protein